MNMADEAQNELDRRGRQMNGRKDGRRIWKME